MIVILELIIHSFVINVRYVVIVCCTFLQNFTKQMSLFTIELLCFVKTLTFEKTKSMSEVCVTIF